MTPLKAVKLPKTERSQSISKQYSDASSALLARLEELSGQLAAMASYNDAYVDQLLALKQLAWLLRNSAGDRTAVVAHSIDSITPGMAVRRQYDRLLGNIDFHYDVGFECSASARCRCGARND
jgi:hypothetical protein